MGAPRGQTQKNESAKGAGYPNIEPPPYSAEAPSNNTTLSNVETASSLTAVDSVVSSLSNLDFKPSQLELPTATECITHLKLLHAFAKLRHDVGNRDGLFGIEIALEKHEDARGMLESGHDATGRNDSQQPEGVHGQGAGVSADEATLATLAERIREKRWTVFVTKAVDRFEAWWDTLPSTCSHFPGPIRTDDFDTEKASRHAALFHSRGAGMAKELALVMPPLDVLMVWHAYLLNPRAYFEDCIRMNKHELWQTEFPWEYIHNAISHETFEYVAPAQNIENWTALTLRPWDPFEDHNLKSISCPKCTEPVLARYTVPSTTSGPEVLEAYLLGDTGFAGENFNQACPGCQTIITHEKMRAGKFINDAQALLDNKRPMPGTILNSKGTVETTARGKTLGTHDPFFPNRLVEKLPEFKPDALRQILSMDTIRLRIQNTIASPSKVQAVNWEQYKTQVVGKESKIAVRKMLSHYWDNSSPFGLDLVGAVIRQGGFVQKMNKIDWIHSPAGMTTMQRLIVKYHRFTRVIAENPKKIAVPTLDVDLAWHTHQLTPKVYYRYTLSETRKFLNHDDKIPESSLHTNFQWTSAVYEKKYGQPYSECACWYCECTREPLRSSFTNKFNPLRASKQYNVDTIAELALPRDAVTGPHISSHNAVKAEPRIGSMAQERRRELESLDLQYAKVCKRYQKKKRTDAVPSRDNDAYVYGAYGYPMYYPIYVPYYADPTCDGDRYTTTGGGGGGGCGSCVAGTCSASASLGGCAGSGGGGAGCSVGCGGGCGGGGGGGCGGGGCGGGCGG